MQVIEQSTPVSTSSSKSKNKFDSFFDDYEIVETSTERGGGSSFLSGLDRLVIYHQYWVENLDNDDDKEIHGWCDYSWQFL